MNKTILLLLLLSVFCRCDNRQKSELKSYDSAEILYWRYPVWGDSRMGTLCTEEALRGGVPASIYKSYKITDSDSLAYIAERIRNASMQPMRNGMHDDAVVIALLKRGNMTDTLASDVFTGSAMQFNRMEFIDSTLVLYFVDGICARESKWQLRKDDYFWDGVFHQFDREFYYELIEDDK